MRLTKLQKDLLTSLQTSYTTGLSEDQTSTIRKRQQQQQRKNSIDATAIDNTIKPPIDCPSWACVLLPCINHLPSVKLFKLIQPHDAEVIRDGRWVFYDAISLMVGDIIRLNADDIVPADCTVLSLGMDHCNDTDDTGGCDRDSLSKDEVTELVVDVQNVIGDMRPKSITLPQSDESSGGKDDGSNGSGLPVDSQVELYCGSQVLEGSAIAVVTRIGTDTHLSRLIKHNKWPPVKKVRHDVGNGEEIIYNNVGVEDEEEDLERQSRNIA